MHRNPRRRDRSGVLDLDSLMDILSCLVGVMLFLVIYTVLELGSATYEAEVPIVRDPPANSEPVVVIAEGGTIRVLDVRAPLERLLSGIEIVRLPDLPLFVRQANELGAADAFFEYSISHPQRLAAMDDPLGALDLHIVRRPEVVGDSLHQLDGRSAYATLLDDMDPEETWLAFAVDSASVNVFRKAREMANTRGFASHWDLVELEFPLTHPLGAGGVDQLLARASTDAKPLR
jgi:hypothetical protein